MPDVKHILRSPCDENDWLAYHAIRRKVLFENRGHFGTYIENHPDEFLPNHHPLVLIHQGAPVGVIRIDVAKPVAWFRKVAITDELQGHGHGRILLRLAESFVCRQGCNEIRSNVAADAVGFYERCGYSRGTATGHDTTVVLMTRTLSG